MKEKFENHPVVFGITMVIIGFVAGFNVYPSINPQKALKPVDPVIKIKTVRELIGCKIEGVEVVTASHHTRLGALQKQLMAIESEAANKDNFAYKYQYEGSASRIRNDIEIKSYENSLQVLNKKCSTKT